MTINRGNIEEFKTYLRGDHKGGAMSTAAISSCISRLKRVPKLLGIELDSFLTIKNSRELASLLLRLKGDEKFKGLPKGSQSDILSAFKTYMQYVKPASFSSYASYMKRVPIILRLDPDVFFKIDNVNKLTNLLSELKDNLEFNAINKKSQANVLTAFRRYIESFQNLNSLEHLAQKKLRKLHKSYLKFVNHELRNEGSVTLIDELSGLFRMPYETFVHEKKIIEYLDLGSLRALMRLQKVAQNIDDGKYHEMVAKTPELTAEVLAIRTHIKTLGCKDKAHD